MKKKRLLLLSLFAVLTVGCGITLLTCCSDSDDKAPLSPTDDSSQFVTLICVICSSRAKFSAR